MGVVKSYVKVSSCGNIVVGDWVIAQYDEKSYPGVVDIVGLNDVQVSVMHRMFTGFWKWPEKADRIFYPIDKYRGRSILLSLLAQEGNTDFLKKY